MARVGNTSQHRYEATARGSSSSARLRKGSSSTNLASSAAMAPISCGSSSLKATSRTGLAVRKASGRPGLSTWSGAPRGDKVTGSTSSLQDDGAASQHRCRHQGRKSGAAESAAPGGARGHAQAPLSFISPCSSFNLPTTPAAPFPSTPPSTTLAAPFTPVPSSTPLPHSGHLVHELGQRHELSHQPLGGRVLANREGGQQPDELDVVRQPSARVVHVIVGLDEQGARGTAGVAREQQQRRLMVRERLQDERLVPADGLAARHAQQREEVEEAGRVLAGGQPHKVPDRLDRHERAGGPVVFERGRDGARGRNVVRDQPLLDVRYERGRQPAARHASAARRPPACRRRGAREAAGPACARQGCAATPVREAGGKAPPPRPSACGGGHAWSRLRHSDPAHPLTPRPRNRRNPIPTVSRGCVVGVRSRLHVEVVPRRVAEQHQPHLPRAARPQLGGNGRVPLQGEGLVQHQHGTDTPRPGRRPAARSPIRRAVRRLPLCKGRLHRPHPVHDSLHLQPVAHPDRPRVLQLVHRQPVRAQPRPAPADEVQVDALCVVCRRVHSRPCGARPADPVGPRLRIGPGRPQAD
eukprot:scaffold11076_cov100-Isochrysis_galbana.AAC.3